MSIEGKLNWKEVRERLLSEGFLEVGGFWIELTLDNTFMEVEYLPPDRRLLQKWGADGIS